MADLSGRTAVVTGASRGIGAAAAEHLARHGARLIILCPSAVQGRAAAETVRRRVLAARVDSVACDLADLHQVRKAAERIVGLVGGRLDVLINNAGVAALPLTRSPSGHEMHFAVNHLGHFALTGHLLPALLKAPRPRVVNVSSVLHWLGRCRPYGPLPSRRYHRWWAYFDSKLANLLFTQGLAAWAQSHQVPLRAIAAHPGLVNTTLGSSALRADGRGLEARLLERMQARWHSPSQAAWPPVRAVAARAWLGCAPGRVACDEPAVLIAPFRGARFDQALAARGVNGVGIHGGNTAVRSVLIDPKRRAPLREEVEGGTLVTREEEDGLREHATTEGLEELLVVRPGSGNCNSSSIAAQSTESPSGSQPLSSITRCTHIQQPFRSRRVWVNTANGVHPHPLYLLRTDRLTQGWSPEGVFQIVMGSSGISPVSMFSHLMVRWSGAPFRPV
ncbi:hypothetical protein SGLAM104S_02774 [Streptomyces glaucescens]